MTEKEIVLSLVQEHGITQGDLAKMTGLKRRSNLWNLLYNSKVRRMRVDSLLRFLKALGYELVIRSEEDPYGKEYRVE